MLVFCEESDSAKLVDQTDIPMLEEVPDYEGVIESGRVVIIGYNEFLSTIVFELPENVPNVILADVDEEYREEILGSAGQRETPLTVTFFEKDIMEQAALEELAELGDHFILLSSHKGQDDSSDLRNIFQIMTLRDVRNRKHLQFNISMELRQETNQNLLIPDTGTEFVVSSQMSSLFLAQLSESPELLNAFDELLTNKGNEIYLKTAKELHCEGTWSALELRLRILPQGYVTIGYMDAKTMTSHYDLTLKTDITLEAEDMLIVIGEN